ncbi:endonuclease MutS2, partial [Dysgonomonas sp. Marseille-P4677]|nr:endonuclease MutS2 [Dysgonomonas sp. Marseille-P4677]
MIYPENFEIKIGFDKIRQLLAAKCLSSLGKEKVQEMAFSSDHFHIKESLFQTDEFKRIIQEGVDFPTNYFLDVRSSLRNIHIAGPWI